MPRTALLGLAIIVVVSAPPRSAQAQTNGILEQDRYIKLGTRMGALAPGEGGQLAISAPSTYCVDDRYRLDVAWVGRDIFMPMARALAGPSTCRWELDALPAGPYDVCLADTRDERIVAIGIGRVDRGATGLVAVAPLDAEIVGRLTANGVPVGSGLNLWVRGAGIGFNHEWMVPVDLNGGYQVMVSTADSEVCFDLRRPHWLNSFRVGCHAVRSGLQRVDFDDVRVPPGVIRVTVPPVEGADPTRFARITVDGPGGPFLSGFRASRGLNGDYFATGYGTYVIQVVDSDNKTAIDSIRVVLSEDQPLVDVRLSAVPAK